MPSDLGTTGAGPRPSDEPTPRSRRGLVIVAGLLVMSGVGAWIGSQYKDEIFSLVQAQNGGDATETGTTTAHLETPKSGDAESPSSPPAAGAETPPSDAAPAAAPDSADVDRALQGRRMWVTLKQEFPEWYQERVSDIARLNAENRDAADITRYQITEIVKLRRANSQHALAASTSRHKDLASAFLANLQSLGRDSGDECYEFISRGEQSAAILRRLQDPSQSESIEAQVVATVAAISEGRKQPAQHASPIQTDYDVLAGELGRLGWTQADIQLFADPKQLAKAPRERVCRMLQDWFTAHLSIQDPNTQERLLFETLKPVVSG